MLNLKSLKVFGVVAGLTFTFSYLYNSNKEGENGFSDIVRKTGLKYELIKPKARSRGNFSDFNKRSPSSFLGHYTHEEQLRDNKDNARDEHTSKFVKNKSKIAKAFNKTKTDISNKIQELSGLNHYAPQALNQEQFITSSKKSEEVPSVDDDTKVITYALSQNGELQEGIDEPQENDNKNSSSKQNPTPIPMVVGTIPPLNGIITKQSFNFPFSAYAAVTCTDPKVQLFDIVTMTPLEDNPVSIDDVDSTTTFSFDVSKLGLDKSSPSRYKVKVYGCDIELEKIVTSYYATQNITPVTSLLAQITNTDLAYNPTTSFTQSLIKAETIIDQSINNNNAAYADVYNELSTNIDAQEVFQSMTEGQDIIILKEAAPKMKSFSIPVSMIEDQSYSFSALASHWDGTYQLAYQWILDGVTVSNANTWNYTPPNNTAATASIELRVGRKNLADNNVDTSVPYQLFTDIIDVQQINDAPTLGASQSISVTEDTPLSFTLMAGNDVDSPSIDYIFTTQPTNGTISCVGTSNDCTYTPNPNYFGTDTLTYKVNDGELDSTVATLNITVNNVNDLPVIGADQSFSVDEDNTLLITLNSATDLETPQASLTYKIINAPSNGTLTNCITTGVYGSDLTCSYNPNLNFNGSDSFTYIANDGTTDSAQAATVSIMINAVNDAPILAATQSISTNEDTVVNFDLNAGTDVENTPLNYNILTTPASGTLSCTQGISRACTYTPTQDFFGSVTFDYRVDDGELSSTTATVTITVNAVNDAPVMGTNQSQTTNEDTVLDFIINDASDVDIPAQTISYKLVSAPTNGTLTNCFDTISYIADTTCTYTPNANYNGADSFTYIANDSVTDAITTATVTFTVISINDAPTLALTQTVSTNEDTDLNFTLNAGADVENDTLSYMIVSPPSNGTLTCDGGTSQNCNYSPELNFNGSVSFVYKVNDGSLDSNTATVTINITSQNDPPVMAGNQSETTAEDTVLNFTLSGATDVDIPAQTLQYKIITAPTNGTLTNCATTGSYSTDITCTYTPNLNFNGTDSFTYRANDTLTDSSTDATVSLTITAVNDAPTLASTQTVSTLEDTALSFNLTAGSDIENSSLDYIIVSNPSNATLSCTGGTSTACTLTPVADFNGSTTFTYKVNDGQLDSTIATVTVNVTPVNDAPVMIGNQNESVNEDASISITLTGANDIDIPAQTLSYKLVTAPANGLLTNCITSGSYTTDVICTYTPNANFNGSDSFTYLANDTITDSTTSSTVNIVVNPVNDAPTLVTTQSIATNEDTPITFNLNAGSDIDLDTLSYIKVTDPSSGTLACIGGTSRECTYTPALNFNGATSFTYKVNDAVADSPIATVNITVNSINDIPVMAADQSFSVNDNTTISITLSNATDVDGDVLLYKVISAPSNGTLSNCITTGVYGSDLVCDYISNTNFHGIDSFTFIANDGTSDAATVETVSINVTDVTPSAAPIIALSSATYTNSTNNTLTVSSCSDISFVLINEGTQPTPGDLNWQACNTTASAITYTLATTTQGLHTLKAWSKDPHGNVSTSATGLSVYYDTILPSLALTTPTIQKGGNIINLQWTLTDQSNATSQNFQVDFFNGSTWSSVGTTPSINGPLTAQAFSKSWTVPSLDITTAKFRVSYTDLAGNSTTTQSNAFEIDSTAPVLNYTSPNNNSYHLSSTTITGNCEDGLNINISGDLQANFSILCSGGSFNQTVNFSDGDGGKNITINQVDTAGNSTSVTRTFIRDEVAPILTKTAGISPDFTNANTPNAWSGTCEGTYTIFVTGDETTSFNCSSGIWNWTPSPKTIDGTYVYNLVQTDAAGNTSSPALSLSWERDATAPIFNATSPVQIEIGQNISRTVLMDTITVSGICEGNNVIAVSGAQSDTISCSSSAWTWTSQAFTTDATRAFTFTQSDSAGNTSALTYTWTRDSNFPALAIDIANIKNNGTTATFTGTCEDGLTINITGSQTTTATCTTGTWSWTTASTAADVNNTYNFAQTNASSNTSTVQGYWYRETGLPVINSIAAAIADPSPTNFIPYSLSASSQNANVNIIELCMKSNDSIQPAANDACWVAVNSSSIGIAPAQNVTIPSYSYLLGWEPALYSVYAWVKDEAGNISANTATQDTDFDTIIYSKDDPPLIWDIAAANNDTSAIPPTRSETSVPTGTDLYIRWKVDDAIGLNATAINLFYTQDEQTFTAIAGAQGIAPHTNHNCPSITLAVNEGCFKWTGGSPLATAYKIRVKVTNISGISTQLTSTPLNADKIKIIAGNTEAGLGGDARTALFFNKTVGDSSDIQSLVFTDDGNIYFADYKRGIITVDPADGKQKLFIQKTGTSTGDGGPAESATLNYPLKITLDYQGRLLIWDYNRIRRVDLNLENPTIETIIGGGTNTADTVVNPLDLKMENMSTWDYRTNSTIFTTLPNGDLWFNSDRPESLETTELRIRVYKAATGQITSRYLGGTGNGWQPTQDLSKCRLGYTGIKFNPTSSQILGIKGNAYHHPNFPGCGMYTSTSSYNYTNVYYDPATGQAIPALDDSYRWYHYYNFAGMDGQMYVTMARSYMNRNNFDGTYTRILGSGTRGECADGTLATACNMDIYGVFVDKNSKVYFNDRGRIRTLDADGKVVTIFGQGYSYGDGVNAVNSRFGNISRVTRLDNGKIYVNETSSYYLKEFTIEGNIDIISGNGSNSIPNTIDPALGQSVRSPYWAIADKATGNIYSTRDDHYGRMAMLNRTTGKWEDLFTNTAGTNYETADGMVAADQDIGGNDNRGLPSGFANGILFQSRMKYNTTDVRYEGFMLKSYDSADSYRQGHVLGTTGYGVYGPNESCVELQTASVSGATCEFEYWDNYRNIVYDSVDAKYVTAKMYRGAQRRILSFKNGNVQQIGYTARNIDDGFTYVRRGGVQYLYYCSGNRLYAHNIDTDTDLGALDWSMTQLSCRGVQFDYNPTNDSIIFPFEQNGLYGVAEYFLP